MKKLLKIIYPILIVLVIMIASVLPVYAMANPDTIAFGSVSGSPEFEAFTNVSETGDMLFMAESYIYYSTTPSYDSSSAFLFELLSPDGLTIIASIPVWYYGDVPVSIYLTASQVTTLGLTSGTQYNLRLVGSPLLFPTVTEGTNMVTVPLASQNWFDQSLNSAGILSPIRAFSLKVMTDIQTHYGVNTYLTPVNGKMYVTDVGSSILLGGVNGLDTWCPQIFQFTVTMIVPSTPSSTGTYANSLSPLGQLGTLTDTGLKGLGQWLGLGTNGVMAGGILYLALTLGAVVWMATKIQSPLVLPIGTLGLLTIGGFLGFVPLSILFMVAAFIVVLTAIYFFTRGFWT